MLNAFIIQVRYQNTIILAFQLEKPCSMLISYISMIAKAFQKFLCFFLQISLPEIPNPKSFSIPLLLYLLLLMPRTDQTCIIAFKDEDLLTSITLQLVAQPEEPVTSTKPNINIYPICHISHIFYDAFIC